MSSNRLGRGLNELFKDNYNFLEEQQEYENIIEINLNELKVNPYQPRKNFNEDKIDELAQSIHEHGVIQPIIVKRSEVGYYIVAGERRFRACKKLGKLTIPAIVRNIEEKTMAEIALLENLQRENLSLIEEAWAYKMLIDKHSYTQLELATRVGKSRVHITNTLRLLNLPKAVQDMISDNSVEFGHAKILAGLASDDQVIELANRIKAENLSVRMLEQVIKENDKPLEAINKPEKRPEKEMDLQLQFLQDDLINKLGTSIKIVSKSTGGKLIIDFSNHADLNRILDIMKLLDE
jgi:ParB family chromosome partitioning protein